MFQANFQKQQEDADIDAVIMCHHGGRHDAPLSGLLVPVNRQLCLHRFHDPGLGIAGAGSEPGDIADIAVIRTMPHFIQRFALAFEHILSELVLGHFRNGDHDNEIQTVIGPFLCFADPKPQGTDIPRSKIQIQLLSNVSDIGQITVLLFTVYRYIRLTHLIPEILTKVDNGEIAMSPAVEMSYLTEAEQYTLLDAMERNDCTPSHAQAIRMKKLSQQGQLPEDMIYTIMEEEKPNQKEQIRLPRADFRKYFPPGYPETKIRQDIEKALELLMRQRQRSRDAR